MTFTSIMRPGRKTLCGFAAAILIFGALVAPTPASAETFYQCLQECEDNYDWEVILCWISYDYNQNPLELQRCLTQAEAFYEFCQIICVFQNDPPPK